MTKLYTPTDAAIGAWVGDQSFSRGQRYYRDGAVTNPRRQGDTLKAQCVGSAPQPYRVEVALGKNQIVSDHCSCPIGGRCKHVAALLLTWLHDADEFVSVEELNAALGKRNKEELISLIVRMINHYPDLETLLEMPLPGAAQAGKILDPKLIERQVNQVFRGWDYEYDAGLAAPGQLAEIRALGDQYAASGDWPNAVVVYHTVAQGALDHYEYDDEGELGEVADECVSGLGEALTAVTDPALREVILRYLFEIYHWDLKSGGYGVGDETPGLLVERTTPAEKEMLAQLARAAMPTGNDWSAGWQRQALGALLLDLEADTLDDETYLRICRETGRTYDLVDRLLSLNRIEEALEIVQEAGDYELLTMEPLFTQHDQFEIFARLVAGRAPATQDARIKRWLKQHIEKQGNLDQALSLAQELFWLHPSLEEYSQMKRLAEALARWPALQQEIMDRLRREPRYHDLLIRIYLQEREIDQALEMVRESSARPTWPYGYGVSSLALDVARAAEETRPQAAIDIYTKQVQRYIDDRNRSSYASAAALLQRMRPLYQRIDQEAAWRKLVADTRANNPRLRALHDEMTKAGLR